MKKRIKARVNIYSELCPASAATIMGAGLLTLTMGSISIGLAVILAGIGVGILGPITKSIHNHHKR